MRTVTINLYEFSELQGKARERATESHRDFLDNEPEQYEDEDGTMKEEYIEHSTEDTIESIEANEYLYYQNGEMAYCVTYCGAHPMAGTTELNLHGKTYKVNPA